MPPHSNSEHPARWPDARLQTECTVERFRRGGPGGQHRNKVETAIRITHCDSGITVEANERRTQAENLTAAWRRLRIQLAVALRSDRVLPAALSRQYIHDGRLRINHANPDYPSVLAGVLDELAAREWDLQTTAEALETSSSQLARFLRDEPDALAVVNEHRTRLGLGRIR